MDYPGKTSILLNFWASAQNERLVEAAGIAPAPSYVWPRAQRETGDSTAVPDLSLKEIESEFDAFMGDGANDGDPVKTENVSADAPILATVFCCGRASGSSVFSATGGKRANLRRARCRAALWCKFATNIFP
jgi:hypothetical protein